MRINYIIICWIYSPLPLTSWIISNKCLSLNAITYTYAPVSNISESVEECVSNYLKYPSLTTNFLNFSASGGDSSVGYAPHGATTLTNFSQLHIFILKYYIKLKSEIIVIF